MKNKFLYIAACIVCAQAIDSCKRELNVNSQERTTPDKFYQTEAQAFQALVSVYDRYGFQAGGLYDKLAIMDVAGDDQVAGGGGASDINDLQVTANYTLSSTSGPESYLWSKGYSGIYRANVLLAKIAGVNMDAPKKARYIAETKTMRAAFYFDLVTFFKKIPLIDGTVEPNQIYTVEQTTPDKIYAYVEKDLNDAMADLPVKVDPATEAGRLNKGAAQALLGKVLLYEKKWQAAADQFAVVNGTNPGVTPSVYGYKLLPNFADLWVSTNKFNAESIIEFVHSNKSNGTWSDAGASEGNLINIISAPRGYSPKKPNAPDFYPGYGFLPFTKDFAGFMKGDPRYAATMVNLDSLRTDGTVGYSDSYNNTGYFMTKYVGRQSMVVKPNTELNFGQDEYEIRLADTYLMEAEALMNAGASVAPGSRAYQLFNAVRARVGLPAIALTQANLETERRLEFAGEGLRWPDLVRWGKAAAVLAFKGFVAGKNEVFPIPQSELNNTKLSQNDNY